MAKIECIHCHKTQSSVFSWKLADGAYVCSKCTKQLSAFSKNKEVPCPVISELTQETFSQWLYVLGEDVGAVSMPDKQKIIDSLTLTKRMGNVIFNGFTHEIKLPGIWGNDKTIKFENLVDFELLEDGTSITKGGIGRALAGGVLFGPAGAVVGGVTGRKSKKVCTSLRILLTLKGTQSSTEYIDFIRAKTESYSIELQQAQEVMAGLQLAYNMVNEDANLNQNKSTDLSTADEILKLKDLLDQGIISNNEFEAGKKAILGMQ